MKTRKVLLPNDGQLKYWLDILARDYEKWRKMTWETFDRGGDYWGDAHVRSEKYLKDKKDAKALPR